MTKKDFHKKEFDIGTKSKLDIFKEYFKESFPVFVHSNYFKEILIYDFFAGQGINQKGEYGTAFNILNEIITHCSKIKEKNKKVYVILNDKDEFDSLKENVGNYLSKCRDKCKSDCIFKEDENFALRSRDFEEYFNEIYPRIKKRKNSAKLVFLDPYNFVIDKSLFSKLIELPSTDFICFMPSSFLIRFPEEPAFKRYIDSNEINFKASKPAHCHRAIADYFKSLIPNDKEYYIGSFSIKKGGSYYGLLFGSNHTLGAEKFQRVCWKKDSITGEADYNIDRELVYNKNQGVLFEEVKIPIKIKEFKRKLKEKILNREIEYDIEAYKFALKNKCLVSHSADVLKEMIENKMIEKLRTKNSDIHKIKQPTKIKLL